MADETQDRMERISPEGRGYGSSRVAMLVFGVFMLLLVAVGLVLMVFDGLRAIGAGLIILFGIIVLLRWPVIAAGLLRAREEGKADRESGAS